MAKFTIKEYPDRLIIRQKTFSLCLNAGREVFIFVASLMVLVFPYEQLIELHKYAWLVYFIPIIPLVAVIRKAINIFTGWTFELNKSSDLVLENDKVIDQLSNVIKVEWNIIPASEQDECHLELLFVTRQNHRISTTGYLNKEHLELGKHIARFLKIEFHHNSLLRREILYFGQNNVNQNDLDFVDNKD
ncbi:MAG TPA: hypothetical protein DIW47_10285 [Bacteroidetes bacterium]|nr:hypothetical protein [Bacteroidota bacterium]